MPRRRAAPLLLAALAAVPVAVRAQEVPRWEVAISAYAGAPDGWTQVRENAIAGTRFGLRSDLGLGAAGGALDVAYRVGARSRLRLRIDDYGLTGTVIPTQDVVYNGTTIAGGVPLATRTTFPYFVRGTLTYEAPLAAPGGVALDWTAGLSYTALTFKLQGTVTPASVGHETQEDFVTQELPVPMLGVRATRAIGRRWEAQAGVAAGWLPWVNSLRQEGGEVRLQQTHLDARLGAAYRLTSALRVGAEYRYTGFAQHESSAEDGNDIVLRQHALGLVLTLGL